jgi:hypothetical protein
MNVHKPKTWKKTVRYLKVANVLSFNVYILKKKVGKLTTTEDYKTQKKLYSKWMNSKVVHIKKYIEQCLLLF